MQKNNLKRDKRKKNLVLLEKKYNLIELWENDIINNKEKIILCLKNLKK
jgi:phosphoribosyl-dephospho-CoA transferase